MHWTTNIKNPDKKYGTVLFYWWCGEELSREKLSYQLSIIKDYDIAGIQINYCHSYSGGNSYGLTYPGSPALFSDEWWELFDWFTSECDKYGIKVSLSDYTLSGVGQGYYTDKILMRYPDYKGKRLRSGKDENGSLTVFVETVETSINPIKSGIGELVCQYFFDEFEKRTGFTAGKQFDFFFSDELNFGINGYLWDEEFEKEFFVLKGYNIKEHYRELFVDENDYIKTRTDYYDVMVALMNRNYFGVIYNYHESRGMTYGCDHGSRGYDPVEFGSYFSTQKFNQGPGCDQPNLSSDIIKNKVAASIANVHKRPRVWLEGFYGSGWGTSSEMLTDAICRNYAMGHNLLALHGMYYTTLGGFWEWAPPCNLIRMPYKDAMKELLTAVLRMSYIMSRGYRHTKIAIHYPTASLQCGCDAADVREAFDIAEYIYKNGLDFDFLDDEALLSAEVENDGLKIGSNTYKYIIFPKSNIMRDKVRDLIKQLDDTDAILFRGISKDDICKKLFDICPDVTVSSKENDIYISHRIYDNDHIYMIYGAKTGSKIELSAAGNIYGVDLVSGEFYPVENIGENGHTALICTQTELPVQVLIITEETLSPKDRNDKIHSTDSGKTISVIDEFDIEYVPVLNNKYGDFSLPAYDSPVIPEVRRFRYSECENNELPSSMSEKKVTYGFGPYYKFAAAYSPAELQKLLEDANSESPSLFSDYNFSLRFGKEKDPGVQGYHGLKGNVTDDFMTMGRMIDSPIGYDYTDDGRLATVFIFNVEYSGEKAAVSSGNIKPSLLLLNGEKISCELLPSSLVHGKNRITAVYDKIGRTHLYLYNTNTRESEYPLSMSMYRHKLIPILGIDNKHYSCLSFDAAPGISGLTIDAVTAPEVFVNGIHAETKIIGDKYVSNFKCEPNGAKVTIRFTSENLVCGGALLRSPVLEHCARGKVCVKDLSTVDGLKAYSGAVKYSSEIIIDSISNARYYLKTDHIVSSMEVTVNEKTAKTLFCEPWRADITEFLRPGVNKISLTVYNTLSNNYYTLPTKYRGKLEYGIMSPVHIYRVDP